MPSVTSELLKRIMDAGPLDCSDQRIGESSIATLQSYGRLMEGGPLTAGYAACFGARVEIYVAMIALFRLRARSGTSPRTLLNSCQFWSASIIVGQELRSLKNCPRSSFCPGADDVPIAQF
jgi:hypothetical protein